MARRVFLKTRPAQFHDFRGVWKPVGLTLLTLAAALTMCSGTVFILRAIDAIDVPQVSVPSASMGAHAALLWPALFCLVVGLVFYRYLGDVERITLTRREGTLSVAAVWLGASLVGAVPFYLGADMSMVDGFFEAVSGLTTTGSTAISDIETRLDAPLLLWRSLLQWLGGMGIVVLFLAVFPTLGVGARHLFRSEVPGAKPGLLTPRLEQTAAVLWRLYVALTIACLVAYWMCGMTFFEALCHSLTTLSTGGFSTRDASIGAFDSPAIELVSSLFMLIATVNYTLYYRLLIRRSFAPFARNGEFRAFAILSVVSIAMLAFVLVSSGRHELFEGIRAAVFVVSTTVSSTGYGVDDVNSYPPFGMALVIGIMFVGGCAGSTAGGIKIQRFLVLIKLTHGRVRAFFDPHVVRVIRVGKQSVERAVVEDISGFLLVYGVSAIAGVLLFTWTEQVPVATAFGMIITALSNMGPAPFYNLDPSAVADNFSRFSDLGKVIAAAAMLLGRLEFFTLLALLSRRFWRP